MTTTDVASPAASPVAEAKAIQIGIAGNPNTGKTTIFNELTGANQRVANYPGVTVEKREGRVRHADHEINILDLPGTYSLTAYSVEEVIARKFVIDEKPDTIVDVLDAANLERNLYLATQFMELQTPLVLALNMSDLAERRGVTIDTELLAKLVGVPVIATVGHRGVGLEELKDAIVQAAEAPPKPVAVRYGEEVERELTGLGTVVAADSGLATRFDPRWLALKLLENDDDARGQVEDGAQDPQVVAAAATAAMQRLLEELGDAPAMLIAAQRYDFIADICRQAVVAKSAQGRNFSDRIDAFVLHRALGLPVFLGLMYLVFKLTFALGDAPMGWIEEGFAWLGGQTGMLWPRAAESPLRSLLVDGIIGGVGGVLVFLPNIILLFMAISILEASGYMARAAFLMDRLMRRVGLQGKSFIPMLVGFGCSVPAIMATRTLESRRDRLTTMLVLPLMSCGARLPIYALIIPAFFPRRLHAAMLLGIYVIGIALAVIMAKALRVAVFKGEASPLVMELPPYRMPTVRGVLQQMLERSWMYAKKAGTIILGIAIVMWAITAYPKKRVFAQDYDALTQRAQTEYLARAKDLNAGLGLPPASDAIPRALAAELALAAEQEQHYEHEPAFDAAAQQQTAALGAIFNEAGGDRVKQFLALRQAIEAARDSFADEIEENELEPESAPYNHARQELDNELAKLERSDPGAYAAATRYLDEVKAPFAETLASLQQAQQGEELTHTIAGRIGHALEPPLRLMGFDWRIGTALIGALAAKEVFVAQMGIVCNVGEATEESETLRSRLKANYPPLVAFCIMLFCLVSAPCMATIATTRQESNSWRWALFQLAFLTVLAFVLTVGAYQIGRLTGIGI